MQAALTSRLMSRYARSCSRTDCPASSCRRVAVDDLMPACEGVETPLVSKLRVMALCSQRISANRSFVSPSRHSAAYGTCQSQG